MDNAYFYYKATMAYYQARPGLSYPVLFFQESVGSINAAYVITANVNKNILLIKPQKIPQLQKILMTYKHQKAAESSGTLDKHLHRFIFGKRIKIILRLLFRIIFGQE